MNDARARKILTALQQQGLDGYVLQTLLGYGGSAAVYKASGLDGNVYAVKVYDAEFTDQEVRLERELSLRGHACRNVVHVYAGGKVQLEEDSLIYMVMEFVEGDDLRKLIRPEHRLEDRTIRDYLRQLCVGARFLLDAGLCHRDIKPENIRVTPDEKLVLLDLGVLKPIGVSDLTDDERGRRFIATRRYTPPELQHRQERDTPEGWEAVTVYQIGAVLFEMIQGSKLFSHVPDHPPADLVVAVDNLTPQLFRSDIGQDLVSLARGCLIKDPTQRLNVARMSEIMRTAEATPPAVPSAVMTLDAHMKQAADRFSRDIVPLQQAVRRQHERSSEILRAITEITKEELSLPRSGLKAKTEAFNRPKYGLWVSSIRKQIDKRIVHDLRLCVVVSREAKPECAEVSGLGLRTSSFFSENAEALNDLIARSNLNDVVESIWDGVFDAGAFRAALCAWLDRMFEKYFQDTASAYETHIQQMARELEAQLGQAPRRGVSVTFTEGGLDRVAFNSQKEMQIRDMGRRR